MLSSLIGKSNPKKKGKKTSKNTQTVIYKFQIHFDGCWNLVDRRRGRSRGRRRHGGDGRRRRRSRRHRVLRNHRRNRTLPPPLVLLNELTGEPFELLGISLLRYLLSPEEQRLHVPLRQQLLCRFHRPTRIPRPRNAISRRESVSLEKE